MYGRLDPAGLTTPVSHPQIKWAIRGQQETLHVQERFVAGSLAGATAQTIIYPMEVRRKGPAGCGWGRGYHQCVTLDCDCFSLIQNHSWKRGGCFMPGLSGYYSGGCWPLWTGFISEQSAYSEGPPLLDIGCVSRNHFKFSGCAVYH
jgi:hypothetical protein